MQQNPACETLVSADSLHRLQNPYKPSPPGLGLKKHPAYPPELQHVFFEGPPGGYSWVPARNPALLDYEDAEFVLIGHSHDLGKHL